MSWKDILKKDSMLSGKEYFDGEFTEKETDYPKEIQLKGLQSDQIRHLH